MVHGFGSKVTDRTQFQLLHVTRAWTSDQIQPVLCCGGRSAHAKVHFWASQKPPSPFILNRSLRLSVFLALSLALCLHLVQLLVCFWLQVEALCALSLTCSLSLCLSLPLSLIISWSVWFQCFSCLCVFLVATIVDLCSLARSFSLSR